MTPSWRRLALPAVLVALALAALSGRALAQDDGPTVDVVELVGVLDGPLTEHLLDRIAAAEDDGVEVVVVRLDSGGGLGGDVEAVVSAVRASAVPVVVYVGTPGAIAGGAAVFLAEAAHVLALAPTAALGGAYPVDLGGDAADPAATAERLAQLAAETGRSVDFARAAVLDGATVVAVPAGEAGVALAPDARLPRSTNPAQVTTLDEAALRREGIAEVVAPTVQAVLFALDGREVVVRGDPRTLEVDPVTAEVRFANLGLGGRILHTATSPTLAYLLLLAGALALAFEIFQPGFGVAGWAAVLVLGLGTYSLVVLPTNWWWVAVAVIGLVLLGADLAIAGLGIPTIAGTLLLGSGSWLLFDAGLAPPVWLLAAGTAFAAVFFVLIMTTVLRAQGNQALLGAESVTGEVGVVRSILNPEGHIFVRGQLWRARAPESAGRVRTGTKVKVTGLNDQLTLDVELVADEETTAAP